MFGAIRSETGRQANDYRFTGQQLDVASDLYYLRARYYDPSIGRFMTQDPFTGSMTSPQSMNRYAYAQNNPTLLIDPFGLCSAEGGSFSNWLTPTPTPKACSGRLVPAPEPLPKPCPPGDVCPSAPDAGMVCIEKGNAFWPFETLWDIATNDIVMRVAQGYLTGFRCVANPMVLSAGLYATALTGAPIVGVVVVGLGCGGVVATEQITGVDPLGY
jgi:RHS repeat-associated protein